MLEISLADAEDLDEAYRTATEAQKERARTLPQKYRNLMESVHEIAERCMRESENTRIKVKLEAGSSYAGGGGNVLAAHSREDLVGYHSRPS